MEGLRRRVTQVDESRLHGRAPCRAIRRGQEVDGLDDAILRDQLLRLDQLGPGRESSLRGAADAGTLGQFVDCETCDEARGRPTRRPRTLDHPVRLVVVVLHERATS